MRARGKLEIHRQERQDGHDHFLQQHALGLAGSDHEAPALVIQGLKGFC